MPEAKFVLKEPNADKETLVYLHYNFNYTRLKYSTKEKIHPKYWNSKSQRARISSQFKQSPEFNQRLNNIESAVNNAFRRLLNDKVGITRERLRAELDGELGTKESIMKTHDFIEWMTNEIEIMKGDKKPGSIKVYNTLLKHLGEFSKSKKYKLTFESINLNFYELYKNYIFNEKKLLNNTFGKHINTLKTFLNIANEKGMKPNPEYKNRLFKGPKEATDHIYLTSDELDILYAVDLSHKRSLDRVRDFFLIGCHTGLRFSDFTQLRRENLEMMNGRHVFNVITNKTGERVVIPLKGVVMEIWEKYHGELPEGISNQKMNDYLKEIGEIAALSQNIITKKKSGNSVIETIKPKYDNISTHTARRSFATNAFLSGIPAISIMKFTGHATESSFMKYIKVSQERNAALLMDHEFFK